MTQQRDTVRNELFAETNYHVVYEPMRCIRSQRYKLIRCFGSRERGLPANCDDSPSKGVFLDSGYFDSACSQQLLFDLYFDPGEKRNLVEERSYQQIYRNLDTRLQTWMEQTDDSLLKGEVPKPEGAVVGDPSMISPQELG